MDAKTTPQGVTIARDFTHPRHTGRDRSEQVVAIDWNEWSQSSECAADGGAAQRQAIDALQAVLQPLKIVCQHAGMASSQPGRMMGFAPFRGFIWGMSA